MRILKNFIGINSIKYAAILGFITGAGLATTVTFTNAVIPTMKKPLMLGVITGTAHAVGITIASVLIYIIAK